MWTRWWLDRWTATNTTQSLCATGGCSDRCLCGQGGGQTGGQRQIGHRFRVQQVGVVTGIVDRWTTTNMTQVGVVTGVCVDKVVVGQVDNDRYDTEFECNG